MQDKAKANRGRLRVPKEMLRDTNRRKQETAERAAGIESPETRTASVYANAGGDTHHVPVVRADRRRSKRRRQFQGPIFDGSQAPALQSLHQSLCGLLMLG